MAEYEQIGGDHQFVRGDAKNIEVEVLDSLGVPIDVALWTSELVVKTHDDAADIEIGPVAGSAVGVYSATRTQNTQRLRFPITEADTEDMAPGEYRFSARRTDAGLGGTLSVGPFILDSAPMS